MHVSDVLSPSVFPAYLRSIYEPTLMKSPMNVSSVVKHLGVSLMFAYIKELTLKKDSLHVNSVVKVSVVLALFSYKN